jgi:hypothetical protein
MSKQAKPQSRKHANRHEKNKATTAWADVCAADYALCTFDVKLVGCAPASPNKLIEYAAEQ